MPGRLEPHPMKNYFDHSVTFQATVLVKFHVFVDSTVNAHIYIYAMHIYMMLTPREEEEN